LYNTCSYSYDPVSVTVFQYFSYT